MADNIYCYPGTNILINKLNIKDKEILFEAEKKLTFIRLQELQNNPISGSFDFNHLLKIHEYIFQDIYNWAGKVRTVEIGKGNLFCTTRFIHSYANSLFDKYYQQCFLNKNNKDGFVKVLADNYADLNALHPFREGNGRAQREFARVLCLECGYIFDLSHTTHNEMLEASKLSFNKGDNSLLICIFNEAVIPKENYHLDKSTLKILTSDDLTINVDSNYYNYSEFNEKIEFYNNIYEEKINSLQDKKPL